MHWLSSLLSNPQLVIKLLPVVELLATIQFLPAIQLLPAIPPLPSNSYPLSVQLLPAIQLLSSSSCLLFSARQISTSCPPSLCLGLSLLPA